MALWAMENRRACAVSRAGCRDGPLYRSFWLLLASEYVFVGVTTSRRRGGIVTAEVGTERRREPMETRERDAEKQKPKKRRSNSAAKMLL